MTSLRTTTSLFSPSAGSPGASGSAGSASTGRVSERRLLAVALLAGSLVALATGAHAAVPADARPAVPTAVQPSGPCTDESGVTVVVDLTDLGGEVEVGCAESAATGTEALAAAGFVETRDASGLICAINALPDPCPTTFEGSWWSYWFAAPGGEWQSYQQGSDTAVPEPGAVEGWRYFDGSEGPTIAPPVPAAAIAAEEPAEEAAEEAVDDAPSVSPGPGEDDPAQQAGNPVLLPALGLLAVLALAAVLVARRRSGIPRGDGPQGQD